MRDNVSVAIRYLEAWLRGVGAVAIDNLMEDAATAEISRSQVWQWIENRTVTAEGTLVDAQLVTRILGHEIVRLGGTPGDRFAEAADVLSDVALQPEFPTFLTIGAYARYLVDESPSEEESLALAG